MKAITWRTPEGETVACIEKIKMLNQNLDEFRTLVHDMLEDAIWMGCDVEQVRQELAAALAGIKVGRQQA